MSAEKKKLRLRPVVGRFRAGQLLRELRALWIQQQPRHS
jgi:hypothetical protein